MKVNMAEILNFHILPVPIDLTTPLSKRLKDRFHLKQNLSFYKLMNFKNCVTIFTFKKGYIGIFKNPLIYN